ncbi:MAG: glycosyltransferase [Bacillota bacterium]
MHIMHVLSSFGQGGAEIGVVRLINLLPVNETRHSVCSISNDLFMRKFLKKNVSCYSLGIEKQSKFAFIRLYKLFKKETIDIVHVNNFGPWFDCVLAAKMAGIKCILTFHGVENADISFSLLKKIQLKLCSVLTDGFIFVSKASELFFKKITGINNLNNKNIIENGVETELFNKVSSSEKKDLRKKLGLPENKVIIGCVAALRPVKNHKGLIKALSKIKKDFICVIVGDGPLFNELVLLRDKLGLNDKIIFSGNKENISEYLKCFDIFVLNSRTEGLSYAVLEAMSCGLPVIATNVGGNNDLISNMKDGCFVDVNKPEDLVLKIEKFLENESLRKQIGSNAREKTLENYSIKKMLISYYELYKKVV